MYLILNQGCSQKCTNENYIIHVDNNERITLEIVLENGNPTNNEDLKDSYGSLFLNTSTLNVSLVHFDSLSSFHIIGPSIYKDFIL